MAWLQPDIWLFQTSRQGPCHTVTRAYNTHMKFVGQMAPKALSTGMGILLMYLLAAGGGCNTEYDSGTKFPAAAISDRKTWRAGGGIRTPASAIDGDLSTAAVSGYSYENKAIVIDLGKVCLFNTIIIQHGNDGLGFCRRVGISTSLDGKDYTHRAAVPGTRKVSFFVLVTPVLARHVRLQAIVPGNRPWSIAEVHLR